MLERHWEINGNLDDERTGIDKYQLFKDTISKVKSLFDESFGLSLLNKVDFYVDNATADSGYTPISTVVLSKLVVIKLGIHSEDSEDKIAYQFSHELMHIVFRAVFGMEKPMANVVEESICSAAALITIQTLYPLAFDLYNKHVQQLANEGYRNGADVAAKAEYCLEKLMPLVAETY